MCYHQRIPKEPYVLQFKNKFNINKISFAWLSYFSSGLCSFQKMFKGRNFMNFKLVSWTIFWNCKQKRQVIFKQSYFIMIISKFSTLPYFLRDVLLVLNLDYLTFLWVNQGWEVLLVVVLKLDTSSALAVQSGPFWHFDQLHQNLVVEVNQQTHQAAVTSAVTSYHLAVLDSALLHFVWHKQDYW